MASAYAVKDFIEEGFERLKSDKDCDDDNRCAAGDETPKKGKETEVESGCWYCNRGTTVKNKTFILINNRGMNVEHISSFYYDSATQRICIRILETFVYECYVPLSEGPFILANLQKALNDGEDFNFHFSRTKQNSSFFQRMFCARERLYKEKITME